MGLLGDLGKIALEIVEVSNEFCARETETALEICRNLSDEVLIREYQDPRTSSARRNVYEKELIRRGYEIDSE